MAGSKVDNNKAILEYALGHLERERDDIQAKIDHILRQLGGRRSPAAVAPPAPSTTPAPGLKKKRMLSDAARKRIAAAQKRRWAEHRKAKSAQ